MDRQTAMEWAGRIGSYWALVNDGIRTYDDADGVIDDLADAIGRVAEEGGWYSEWDEALSRARPSRPDGMTFGEEMHALANPQCKVNTIAEALPFYMEVIEHHAKKGCGSASFATWVDSKDGARAEEMPKLKLTHAEELARLLGDQGLAVDVRPGDLTGTYVVTVNW